MRPGLLAAAAAVIIAAPAAAQAPTWKTYPFPDLGYAVDLPADPQRSDDQTQTQRGPVPSAFVGAQMGLRAFGVTSADYSKAPGGAPTDVNTTADASMAGSMKGRTILSQSSFSVPGGAGRETISKDGASVARVRVYYQIPHIFIVMTITTDTVHPEVLQDATANRFFASFTPLSH